MMIMVQIVFRRRNQHKGGGGGADPMGGVEPRGSIASDNLIHKLCALQDFMQDINWPDLEFRDHLDQRLKLLAADMIDQAVKKYKNLVLHLRERNFEICLKNVDIDIVND